MLFFASFLSLSACKKVPVTEIAVIEVEPGEGDASATLETAAAELDVAVRARALSLLIRYEGAEWGPRALFDPSPYVQRAGVEALAERDEDDAYALIASLAARDVDPYTRSHAAVALIRAGHSVPDLGWNDERLHWRRAPLALPAAMQGDTTALEALGADLSRGDYPLEIAFFLHVGASGLPVADSLIEGSKLVEEELELAIANALLDLGHAEGESRFREALHSDNLERRLEAVDYLAQRDDEIALVLLKRAKNIGPEPVEDWATLALIARGEHPPDPAFAALVSTDRELRQQAVWSLSHWVLATEGAGRNKKQAHRAIVAMLGDPEPVVVMESIQALGRAGMMDDRALLAGFMSQDDRGMSIEAAGAILAIESRDGLASAAVGLGED
ncbi:MAG TPA: HEAT repeat domain-containing protein [Myxococcota bacterium]|nr:HEAT repeat domain-containing protein [Myxococcota bacterium]